MDPVLVTRLARQQEKCLTGESSVEHLTAPTEKCLTAVRVRDVASAQRRDRVAAPAQLGRPASAQVPLLDPVLAERLARQRAKADLETGRPAPDVVRSPAATSPRLEPALARRLAEQREKLLTGESAVSHLGVAFTARWPSAAITDTQLREKLLARRAKDEAAPKTSNSPPKNVPKLNLPGFQDSDVDPGFGGDEAEAAARWVAYHVAAKSMARDTGSGRAKDKAKGEWRGPVVVTTAAGRAAPAEVQPEYADLIRQAASSLERAGASADRAARPTFTFEHAFTVFAQAPAVGALHSAPAHGQGLLPGSLAGRRQRPSPPPLDVLSPASGRGRRPGWRGRAAPLLAAAVTAVLGYWLLWLARGISQ